MKAELRVVNNRIFLLGLDELYRRAMKKHERNELLLWAQETAQILSIEPANIPIEGYYSEDVRLTQYFRLVRALQKVAKNRESELASADCFLRLKQVITSLIFGPPADENYLLPTGKDSLSIALETTFPDWNIDNLTNTAYKYALNSDDFSLVALAALSRDSVILTALRESVVLYARVVPGSALIPDPEYIWQVDDMVQARAQQFVTTFNGLLGESLPKPIADNAKYFWGACSEWRVIGRCVCIGYDHRVLPVRHYHWAIDRGNNDELIVQDFWHRDVWTTQRYCKDMKARH